MYFCKHAPGPHCRGVHSIVIMKQDFSWTKWWGEKFVHIFAKSGGFLVICFLFLSAQCISSIGQII